MIKMAYIPIGVPTFDLEAAQIQFDDSVKVLREISEDVLVPEKPLLTLNDLKAYLGSISPDFIVLQNLTFANSAYAQMVVQHINCPVILWTLKEPVVDGTRLRLNSLTGAYSAANLFHQMGRTDFQYVIGSPKEEEVKKTLNAAYKAAEMKYKLKSLQVASIGHTPQGFGFGAALDSDLARVFGSTLHFVEARELMDKARKMKDEDAALEKKESERKMKNIQLLPEANVLSHHKLYKAYKDYIEANGIKAIASRCWPDYFVDYGTPVCGVLGLLNDNKIAAACEADIYGAVTMYIGMELSEQPVFFGDPVSLNAEENSITYWHCGTAACSLAREDLGPETGVHPNRKIGPTMEFGCKPCEEVTIFRVGRKPDGSFRFFIANGEALDKPKQFYGTSVVVKTKQNAKQIVENSVQEGWEPHFAVIYKDVKQELEMLAKLLKIEICNY